MELKCKSINNNYLVRRERDGFLHLSFGFLSAFWLASFFVFASALLASNSVTAAPSIASAVMLAPLEGGQKVSYGGDGVDINLTIDAGGASSSYLRYQLWEQFNGGSWVQINASSNYRKISFYSDRDLHLWFSQRSKPVTPGLYKYRVHVVDDYNGANPWSSGVESDVVEIRAPRKAPATAPAYFQFYTPVYSNPNLVEEPSRFVYKTEDYGLQFSWGQVSNDAAIADLFYEFSYRQVNSVIWTGEKVTVTNINNYQWYPRKTGEPYGIRDLQTYEFSVKACNSVGCGPTRLFSKPVFLDYPEINSSALNAALSFEVFDIPNNKILRQNYCFADPITKKCKANFVRINGSAIGQSGSGGIYLYHKGVAIKSATGSSANLSFSIDIPDLEVGAYSYNLTGGGAAESVRLRKHFYVFVPVVGKISSSACVMEIQNNNCQSGVNIEWSGSYPVCLYQITKGQRKEVECFSDHSGSKQLSIPTTVDISTLELEANEPAGKRVFASHDVSASYGGIELSITPDRCDIIRPATTCNARVTWSVIESYISCLYQNNTKIVCSNNGSLNIPLSALSTTFTLKDGEGATARSLVSKTVRAMRPPTGTLALASGATNPCVPTNGNTCQIAVNMQHFGGHMGVTLYKDEVAWGNLGTSGESTPFSHTTNLPVDAAGTKYSLRANYDGALYEFASLFLYPSTFVNQGYSLTSTSSECTYNPLTSSGCDLNVVWTMPSAGACIFLAGSQTGFCPDETVLSGKTTINRSEGVYLFQLRKSSSPDSELIAQVQLKSTQSQAASLYVYSNGCTAEHCLVDLNIFTNYEGNVCLYDNGVKVSSLCGLKGNNTFHNLKVATGNHKFQLYLVTAEESQKILLSEKLIDLYEPSVPYKDLVVSQCQYSGSVCSVHVSWYSNLLDTCIYSKKSNQPIYCEDGEGAHNVTFEISQATGNEFELRNHTYDDPVVLATFTVGNTASSAGSSGSGVNSSSSSSSSSAPFSGSASDELVDGNVDPKMITDAPTDKPVGSVAGQFRVNESGAATYVVNIATAGGVAGVKPEISVGYNSQAGNGLLGKGWSLNGLSGISRCRQTLAHDGAAKAISWSATDRFCLDGQRLMLVSGVYGEAGSVYRTEIDSFITVTAIGGTAGRPDYFEAVAKDGSKTTYGMAGASNTAEVTARDASGQALPLLVLTWSISRFEDSVGNPISYTYSSTADYHRLEEIRYGAGNSFLKFEYVTRTDLSRAFVAGYEFKNNQLLKKIKSHNDNELLRSYEFFYDQTSFRSGNANRLTDIEECVASACYEKTNFDWYEPESAGEFSKPMGSITLSSGKAVITNRLFIDINGNGIQDYIWSDINGYIKYKFDIGLDQSAEPITLPLYLNKNQVPKFEPLDYNADGHQDLLVYSPKESKWVLFISTRYPSSWALTRSDVYIPAGENLRVADVDSDGLADLINPVEDSAQYPVKNSILVYKLKRNPAEPVTSDKYFEFDVSMEDVLSIPEKNRIKLKFNDPQFLVPTHYLNNEIFSVADLNGDGKVDLLLSFIDDLCIRVLPGDECPGGSAVVKAFVATENNEYVEIEYAGNPIPWDQNSQLHTPDLNVDGQQDIAYRINSKWYYLLNEGGRFGAARLLFNSDDKLSKNLNVSFVDINHDGYADVVWRDSEFESTYDAEYDLTTYTEIVTVYVKYWDVIAGQFGATQPLLENQDVNYDYSFMDVNGDAWVDKISTSIYGSRPSATLEIAGFSVAGNYTTTGVVPQAQIVGIEDGLDNKTQISYEPIGRSSHYVPIGEFKIINHTVEYCRPNYEAIYSGSYSGYEPVICEEDNYDTVDAGDYYSQLNSPFADYLDSPLVGEVGQTEGAIDPENLVDAPVFEVTGPVPVVTQVSSIVPTASESQPKNIELKPATVKYYYKNMRMQAAGRGMLGFEYLTTVDEQSGIVTESRYRQDWPFIGSPQSTIKKLPTGQTLSESVNVWVVDTFGEAGKKRFQPRIRRSIEKSYVLDSNGSVATEPLQVVTSETAMEPGEYGNIDTIKITTEGRGSKLVQFTDNAYFSSEWEKQMGRLESATVTTTRDQQSPVIKSARFEYYQSAPYKGLLHKEFIEEETPNQLVKEYIYDQWGNKQDVITTANVEDGTSQARKVTTQYDTTGRYLLSTTNDLNHSVSFQDMNAYGQPLQTTDINNLQSEIKYDAFGQEYLRYEKYSNGTTGAWKRTDTVKCDASCPTGAKFYTRNRVSGGGETKEYFDSMGRVIRSAKKSFDGSWIFVDTEYDLLGRIKRQSLPYFDGQTTEGYVTNSYDLLGRPVSVVSPGDNGVSLETTYSYEAVATGLKTTVTNPALQKRVEIKNGLGQLLSVTDQLDGQITYEYSAAGELYKAVTTVPNKDPITVQMCYDDLGRKIGMHDPDKGGFKGNATANCSQVASWVAGGSPITGWWHYKYNAFGELIAQRDPKGQLSTMKYDQLGRMVGRQDYKAGLILETNTAWLYDKPLGASSTANASNTKGKQTAVVMSYDSNDINAASCSGSNYCQTYTYNDRAQVSGVTTHLPNGQDFFTETAYDTIGRAYQVTDVMDDFGGVLGFDSGVQTQYNENGYAYRTVDMAPWDESDGVLSEIIAMNAAGQVTEELRGNGLTSNTEYYPASGLLKSQSTQTAANLGYVQKNQYKWDDIGNLKTRESLGMTVLQNGTSLQHKNRLESFCYDALNRLTKSTATSTQACGGVQDITYDGFGNIKTKAGVVGTYNYGGSNGGPHAVTSIGNTQYFYDANGNMKNENGSGSALGDRTFAYTSYDMVEKISRTNGTYAEFKYGPDRSRWQRVDKKADGSEVTTTYLGNVERIDNSKFPDEVEWKRNVGGVSMTYKTSKNVAEGESALTVLNADKSYLYKDHLGSIDVITDAEGVPTHTMSFDPWGARRAGDANTISPYNELAPARDVDTVTAIVASLKMSGFVSPVTTRGFTGHEMVDDMGVIHMNGRIYDARIGRFLQADPFIQAATNTQSYNRYSYLLNNPLNATDPSGFFLKKLWNKIRPFVGVIVAAVMTYFCGPCGELGYVWIGGISGAAGAAANGGNILRGAITGMVTAAVFNGIGSQFTKSGNFWAAGVKGGAGHIFSHAMAGGILSALQGGKFGHGFAAAGLSKGFDANFKIESDTAGAFFAETAIVAVVGGTISEMTGGKFANGAVTAAFQHLFNELSQKQQNAERSKIEKLMKSSSPEDRQKAIVLAVKYFKLDLRHMKNGVADVYYNPDMRDYGFANSAGQVYIGPSAFNSLAELGSWIWHETSHQMEMSVTGDTTFTNHVAIYQKQLELEEYFGGYSDEQRNVMKFNMENAKSLSEPDLLKAYNAEQFGYLTPISY